MMMSRLSLPAIAAVWWRQWLVMRSSVWTMLTTNIVSPLLSLFAFGFGLGAVVRTLDGMDYLHFVTPGMIAQAAMFAASFEMSINAFTRFTRERTWLAILSTPVSLAELLAAEVLWATSKAMFAALAVFAVGGLFGGLPGSLVGILVTIPVMILGAACFATTGMAFMAHARTYDFFSYFFTFWVTPMFIFCGVFFPIDRFPGWVEAMIWLLPMPHLLAVMRPLTTGTALDPLAAVGHLAYLVLMSLFAYAVAYRKLKQRVYA